MNEYGNVCCCLCGDFVCDFHCLEVVGWKILRTVSRDE